MPKNSVAPLNFMFLKPESFAPKVWQDASIKKRPMAPSESTHEDLSAISERRSPKNDSYMELTLCASFMAIPMYTHALAQPVGSI